MNEYNIDVNPIRSVDKTNEGYIKLWLGISDANNPLVYLSDKGVIVEKINEQELFSIDSLNTLVGKPITYQHPDVGYLDKNNISKYQVGTILQETRNNEGVLEVAAIITDSNTINKLETNQLKYTSAGYHANKTNIGENVKLQTNRVYNHVALLDNDDIPRAGIKSRIILDNFSGNTNNNMENKDLLQLTMEEITQLIKDNVTQILSEINQESKAEINTDSIENRVYVIKNYEDIIKSKSDGNINYNLDSTELKHIVLSSVLTEKDLKLLDNPDKIYGAFSVYEKLKPSKSNIQLNEDSTSSGINPNSIINNSRDQFIKTLLGDK